MKIWLKAGCMVFLKSYRNSFHMPHLLFLVVATSGAGYVLESSNTVDLAGLHYTCAGTMMVAASASTLNQCIRLRCINDGKSNKLLEFKLNIEGENIAARLAITLDNIAD
ncbi:hypothetical protein Tco_0839267 [Tanacetum coccineum]|uniref:Secreted protein n=1 Tax=Tanacetum coccineum TaxID=301880 RepID=A0ABQ5AQ54_9ASTR